MNLSTDLIDQFVQATNDEPKQTSDGIAYGTVVKDGEKTYVQLDGSTYNTPVTTTTNVKHGERVAVLIKNHTVTITGNFTSPVDSTSSTITSINSFDAAVGKKLSVEELTSNSAFIKFLLSDEIVAETIIAADAKISALEVDKLTVDDLKAIYGNFDTLDAYLAELGVAQIDKATIKELNAISGKFRELKVDYGEFEKVVATKAKVGDLVAENIETNTIITKALEAKFANVDFANVTELAVNNFFAKSGIIQDLTLENGVVVKELVGVTIKGDLIEAGTLKVDRLVVKGSDGNYYKLSTDFAGMTGVEPVEEDMIHGSTIVANSVTAEKINVSDLTAFGAKIAGFTISNSIPGFNDTVLQYTDGQLVSKGSYYCKDPNDVYLCIQDGAPDSLDDEAYFYKEPCIGAIYSGVKSSIDNDTRGVYLDDIGQVAFGDTNSFVKFYKAADGTYKLAIRASEIILGSSGKNIETAINDAITNVVVEYALSSSKDTPPTNYADGNCDIEVVLNEDGTQTLSIVSARVGETGRYHVAVTENDDGTLTVSIDDAITWSEVPPEWIPGMYLWTRKKIVYSNPERIVYTEPVCDISWGTIYEADAAIKDVQVTASATKENVNSALTTINAAVNRVSNNEADIKHLNDVVREIQGSYTTVTIDQETKDATITSQDGTSYTIAWANMNKRVDDASEHREYITFNKNDGDPYVAVAANNSGIKLKLSNDTISFLRGEDPIVDIFSKTDDGDIGLTTSRVNVTDELRHENSAKSDLGNFVWKVRGNGNFGLSWKPQKQGV